MEKSLAWASCGEEEKACVGWIKRYFNDCVCSPSGVLSFGLGMISLLCWGIAEIPQIITNFHSKSGHGVSFAFLLTWVIGDIFNLVGCLLEPVTLPTQLYTALLYTATTVVLVLQTLYYDYWVRWWKKRGLEAPLEVEEGSCKRLNPKNEDLSRPLPTLTASRRTSSRVDVYYTSARSLASSGTPPCRSSYLGVVPARSGPSASGYMESSGSDEEGSPRHQSRSSGVSNPKKVVSRSVSYGTFAAGAASLPFQTKALMEVQTGLAVGRTVQEGGIRSLEGNTYGLLLGWIMAAIYTGGRLPQIYLNGLNPLMFLFALIANATYVGSILSRSVEWERIKANAPWLLDAIVCVLLDLFIIIQFVYYKLVHKRMANNEDDYEGFTETKKNLF
ncbi:probable vacuolar amino acid transporter YPQ1 isoform X2 [Musa acuminata AAA Group]|uniref:probable vacuolar amino acid transporter YPQ1 isoform X2 n=1 Tax=Musa acuminata AAA Group TaxID=214697 RepID=UPI0008A0D9CD|nr:PREDICTED: probable vacuolar amino acid transporter YPQ1 isoform X2 [Musa acuminata subsp. malaccensis]